MKTKEITSEKEQKQKEALDLIYKYVGEEIQKGTPPQSIKDKLIGEGVDRQTADTIVDDFVQYAKEAEAEQSESGGMGWLMWIGIILVINLLSYIFDWPFWLY